MKMIPIIEILKSLCTLCVKNVREKIWIFSDLENHRETHYRPPEKVMSFNHSCKTNKSIKKPKNQD